MEMGLLLCVLYIKGIDNYFSPSIPGSFCNLYH